VRDFLAHPVRLVELLVFGRELDLGHHQALVGAEELVDLPGVPGKVDLAPGLFDDRLLAKALEQFIRLVQRNRVLPLAPRRPR
jgi:hypothetical protein